MGALQPEDRLHYADLGELQAYSVELRCVLASS